jgi:hypothetical protein
MRTIKVDTRAMRQGTVRKRVFAVGIVGSVLVACGGLGAVGSGTPLAAVLGDAACPELRGGAASQASFAADARANGTIKAFVTAAGDLAETAAKVEAEVGAACARIADDLGVPSAARRPRGDEGQVAASCNAVAARIDAILKAGASAQVRAEVTPPRCEMNATAEASCKGQCNATVDPGSIKATCAPGHLYGKCDGTCTGSCNGSCTGACDGQCEGSAAAGAGGAGKCAGKCAGTCKGTCAGECKGGCNVDFKEPKCDVDARAPSADARCEGTCKARADITAQCTEPRVKINANVNAGELGKLVATLERNLPMLVKAQIAYGQRIGADVDVLVRTGVELPSAMGRVSTKAGACLAAAANATVAAQASLRVSVQASASVNAKVSGSAAGG